MPKLLYLSPFFRYTKPWLDKSFQKMISAMHKNSKPKTCLPYIGKAHQRRNLKMVNAIVGANWGDEGKGKITDMMAREADIIVRFQGGANAGHTIVKKGM